MKEIKLEDYRDTIGSINQYPKAYILNNKVIKVHEDNKEIHVGLTDNNLGVEKQLTTFHKNKKVTFYKISPQEFSSFTSKLGAKDILGTKGTAEVIEDLGTNASDGPIIDLVNSIIIDGINMGASDIHIEGFMDVILVRYRIDGILVQEEEFSRGLAQGISSRIKILFNLNIMESRLPQDGRTSLVLNNIQVDLRVSIIPISKGESIVLRLLIKKDSPITLENLGFSQSKQNELEGLLTLPQGLILITGPTGSGKTTTLNALLNILNTSERKIIAIEDPVEYNIPGINQIQVNPDISLDFKTILKRVLRQDPDAIMVGEIRDRETCELVIRAALTGHLVLSTLHTNDAASAILRLRDFGIEEYLISDVLKGVFAQRLGRKLCPKCWGEGCPICFKRGYLHRTAIVQGFIIRNELQEVIANKGGLVEIKKYLDSIGCKSLFEEGMLLVNKGILDIKELKRVIAC